MSKRWDELQRKSDRNMKLLKISISVLIICVIAQFVLGLYSIFYGG